MRVVTALFLMVGSLVLADPWETPVLQTSVHHPATELRADIARSRWGGIYLRFFGDGTLSGPGYEIDTGKPIPLPPEYLPAFHVLMDIRQGHLHTELSAPCPYVGRNPLLNSRHLDARFLNDHEFTKKRFSVYLERRRPGNQLVITKITMRFPFYLESTAVPPARLVFEADIDVKTLAWAYKIKANTFEREEPRWTAGKMPEIVTGEGARVWPVRSAKVQAKGIATRLPLIVPEGGRLGPFADVVDAFDGAIDADLPALILSAKPPGRGDPVVDPTGDFFPTLSSDAATRDALKLGLPSPGFLLPGRVAMAFWNTLAGCGNVIAENWF